MYNGKRYGEEKQRIYRNADIFVFPTYNEAFGLVNLEAMAFQLPIVTTDEGGIPDVVKDGENGLISERRNPQSLADCLEKLIDNRELRIQMGDNGYHKLVSCFTEIHFERNLCKILYECL